MNTGFFQIDNDIPQTRLKEIGVTAFSIFMFLASMANDEATCFPSIEYISEKTGVSRGSVISAIKILKKHDMLKVQNHKMHSNLYILPKDKSSNIVLSDNSKVQNLNHKSSKSKLSKVQNLYPNNTKDNNTKINNTEPQSGDAPNGDLFGKSPPKPKKPKPNTDPRVKELHDYYISKQLDIGEYSPKYGEERKHVKAILSHTDKLTETTEKSVELFKQIVNTFFEENGFYARRRYKLGDLNSGFNEILAKARNPNFGYSGKPINEAYV